LLTTAAGQILPLPAAGMKIAAVYVDGDVENVRTKKMWNWKIEHQTTW